jgi:ribonuclease P protein component
VQLQELEAKTMPAFSRSARLLRHSDFERVYKLGKRQFFAHMTLFYVRSETGEESRIGFTVSKALGNAVQRNRVKRRLREAVRAEWHSAPGMLDIVINPKRALLKAEFEVIREEVKRGFQQIRKVLHS